jgi:hypothetical protein
MISIWNQRIIVAIVIGLLFDAHVAIISAMTASETTERMKHS